MSFLSENLLGILVASVVVLLFVKLRKSFSHFKDKGMPYVQMTLKDFIGSFSPTAFNYLPVEMYRRSQDLDSPYVGYFMNLFKPAILIRDPALAESILIKDFSYFQDHGLDIDIKTNPLAGHLFNLKGDEWRTVRHKLVPTFTSGKLRGMVPIMEECADKLVEEMNSSPALTKDTNLKELFKKYSLSVIASCAFGIDPESVKDPNCQFRQVLQDVVAPKLKSMVRFSILFLFPKITKFLKMKVFAPEAEDFMLSLTKQSLEMRKKTGFKRNDFIQLLLELKEKGSVELDVKDLEQDEKDVLNSMKTQPPPSAKIEFTDELLAAQAFVFLVGGFENVAYLIAINNYLLSKNPEVQERARREVRECKAKHGQLDYQALRDMRLLGACMDEALRMYPPAFVMLRECNKPYQLSDGKMIEKGQSVMIPAYSFHQDPKYWTEPEKFNPDRFLDGQIHPGTYLPFGDGPRICIAQRMALLIVKLGVAKLLLNYKLLPSTKTQEPIVIETFFGSDNRGGFWGSFQPLTP